MDTTGSEISCIRHGYGHLREEIGREGSLWLPDTWDEIRNICCHIGKESPLECTTIGNIGSSSEIPIHSKSHICSSRNGAHKISSSCDARGNCRVCSCFVSSPSGSREIAKCREHIRDAIIDSDCLPTSHGIVCSIVRISTSDIAIIREIESYVRRIGCGNYDSPRDIEELVRCGMTPVDNTSVGESSYHTCHRRSRSIRIPIRRSSG